MLQTVSQTSILDNFEIKNNPLDWTFNGASTRELTHCYHDYPARMIPQVAGKLLELFGKEAKLLFDPYCGTGTTLVEGMIRGINVIGTDLNPLARLIAQAKTAMPDLNSIDETINSFFNFGFTYQSQLFKNMPVILGISRLDFWFKKEVIQALYRIRNFISEINNEMVSLFFKVAFSETVRESSNTRNEEFKLYRYSPKKLASFSPNVFDIMLQKLQRNRNGLQKYLAFIRNFEKHPKAGIHSFNTVIQIPENIISPSSIDIVITSPPYGDSHTTVAYGQYSRLSAAWLGLEEPEKTDSKLMGGKSLKENIDFPCDSLNIAIKNIIKEDRKRALEVSSFYADLFASISNIAQVVKPLGYVCYVVGNRKVKGVVLPTDAAVTDFFVSHSFKHINTFTRSIPNKRMPLRNSPTNSPGVIDNTMTREYIVVLQRI